MNILIQKYEEADIKLMISVWNEVVKEGNAFPQEELLDEESGSLFFASQAHCGVARNSDSGEVCGMYILHPNNIGRCGHIANASYAVASRCRGSHIGEALVKDSLIRAKELGFGVMQFNAVVKTNIHARHLYERLGFEELGTIPKGFRMKDGHYEDICLYYYDLKRLD